MQKELISKYISNAAKYLIKSRHQSYRNVSQKLNLSYGYFRLLMSGNRALTTCDIYELARLEKVPVSNLFPPIDTSAKSFARFKVVTGNASLNNFKKFVSLISM